MDETKDTDALRERVTGTVSRVILQKTGRSHRPGPGDALFGRGGLDPFEATLLAMALQDDFDVTLDSADVNERGLRTVEVICALIRRRTRN